MKNYLLFFSMAIIGLLSITGCTKEYNNYDSSNSIFYTIHPEDWRITQGGLSLVWSTSVPEISDYYVKGGGYVTGALSFDNQRSFFVLGSNHLVASKSGSNPTAYSLNYTTGSVTLNALDPTNDFEIEIPDYDIVLKLVLSGANRID